ncbi:MAG: hypothetical protein ABIH46_09095 [Chloroflexota bacterium]
MARLAVGHIITISPVEVPTSSAQPAVPEDVERVIQLARFDLTRRLGIAPGQVRLVNIAEGR